METPLSIRVSSITIAGLDKQSGAELAIWHLDTVTAPLLLLSNASVTTLYGPFCHPLQYSLVLFRL